MLTGKINFLAFFMVTAGIAFAQPSADLQMDKTVISSGGSVSSGSTYTMISTIGQPLAGGPVSGTGIYGHIGFWSPGFAPTAAGVSVSGRVITSSGRAINNVTLKQTSMNGQSSTVRTGGFGYFRFNNLPSGEMYILTINAKGFTFPERSVTLFVNDHIADLMIVSNEP